MSSPTRKKSKLLEINLRPQLLKNKAISDIKIAWKDPSFRCAKLKSYDVQIVRNPFPVCIIKNFTSNADFLNLVIEELKNVRFYEKSNDLYQFSQTDDVQVLKNYSHITRLYDLIRLNGLEFVNKTLGNNKLKQNISATFSSYSFQDRLLCHDDKCEDRHIAFILYLVKDWQEEDGGALQLFNSDKNGYPQKVVKSIYPEFNTMILFEVTNKSFHQVSEVLSKTKTRLSLNGWFHISTKKLYEDTCPILSSPENLVNDKKFQLENYFSPIYFDEINKIDIKCRFIDDSEIQLDNFIVPKLLDALQNEITSNSIVWTFKGPANIRKYEVAEVNSLPTSIQTVKQIFESMCWFGYLKFLTGLDFVPSEKSDMEIWNKGILPQCRCEIQRWTPTCYTLIHDKDPEFHSKGLDVMLRIPVQEDTSFNLQINDDVPKSGHTIYIDADSRNEECLLHIGYKMNSLSLVYRDKKTLRFTKYLNSTAKPFYQIFCSYIPWRPPQDQPDLKHCEESECETSNSSDDSSDDDYLLE